MIAAQANIHQDVLFAKNFFKAGVWENEFAGVDSTSVSGKQFIKFSNGNSDPIPLSRKEQLRWKNLQDADRTVWLSGVNV